MRVLVVNAGSSSLKLRLVDGGRLEGRWDLPAPDPDPAAAERDLAGPLAEAGAVDAVGHRVVHGGPDLRAPVVVDDDVLDRLRRLEPLAPLHNPPAVAGVAAVRALRPDLPSVACFDTAFHATLPPAAATYAWPWAWTTGHGLRRYGFHGISCAWATRRTAALLDRPADDLRLVICHLGAGASATAVAGGRSIDTTMGFTPLEGLVMATRSGDVDPGALVWLQQRAGLSVDEVADGLERGGGVLGLSGVSGDLREVLAAAGAGHERAALAVDVYVHRLRAGVAAMAAALGGLDALALTGGVGEGSSEIRRRLADGLGFLGVALDRDADAAVGDDDALVGAPGAGAAVAVVHAREDLEIAAQVERALADGGARTSRDDGARTTGEGGARTTGDGGARATGAGG